MCRRIQAVVGQNTVQVHRSHLGGVLSQPVHGSGEKHFSALHMECMPQGTLGGMEKGIVIKEKVRSLDPHIINLTEAGNLLPESGGQKLQRLGAKPVMGICRGHVLHLEKGFFCYFTSFSHG